jgi:hypothetical protein
MTERQQDGQRSEGQKQRGRFVSGGVEVRGEVGLCVGDKASEALDRPGLLQVSVNSACGGSRPSNDAQRTERDRATLPRPRSTKKSPQLAHVRHEFLQTTVVV